MSYGLVADTPQASVPVPPKKAKHRAFVDAVVILLTQGITPSKVALTLAVGSAVAMFPILGTTTLLCILVGVLCRMNQPVILLVNGVLTPLHLPMIFVFLKLGAALFGMPYAHVGIRMMNHMFWDDPHEFWLRFGTSAFHAIVAWAIVAPIWTGVVYSVALPACREIARRGLRAPAACEPVADEAAAAEHPIP